MASTLATKNAFGPLRHTLCSNCFNRSIGIRMMSMAPKPRRDREGNVIRKQPKLWIQKSKAAKREEKLNRETRRPIVIPENCTAKSLASLLGVRAVDVLKIMIRMGEKPFSSEEPLTTDLANLVANELNFEPVTRTTFEDRAPRVFSADLSDFPRRPPVVTVIGHIDHGKTTLLDSLRSSAVAKGEAGGITQHIGAFTVRIKEGDPNTATNIITFMDTPGHEAFTSLRERGVRTTDIALLVVAADDGVQEQTLEAIRVSKEAGVQLIVCITKIDKISDEGEVANTSQLRDQLFINGVEVEGTRPGHAGVPVVEVSAKTGRGMDELKQAIVLQAALMDLRSPIDGPAEGLVLESKMEKGRGPLATVLVRAGTMKEGDDVVVGLNSGRIRFMRDHRGRDLSEAGPGFPVEIIGLKEVPTPGLHIFCCATKEEAETIAEYRQQKTYHTASTEQRKFMKQEEDALKQQAIAKLSEETGGTIFSKTLLQEKIAEIQKEKEGGQVDKRTISIILKTDVAGSVEGVQKALSVLPTDEVGLNIVKALVGPLSEADIALAKTTSAYLVGFNVKANPAIQELARKRNVPIIEHKVVYSIVDAVRDLMSGLLPPRIVMDSLGAAQVRELFDINKGARNAVTVAGCIVTEGIIRRNAVAQVVRDGEVVHESKFETIRSFKQVVAEVKRGNDCGVTISGFNDFKVGDVIRSVVARQIPRKLGEPSK